MFGRGKFQNGVIIEPTQPFDPTDSEKLAKFRNDVWYVMLLTLFLLLYFTTEPVFRLQAICGAGQRICAYSFSHL